MRRLISLLIFLSFCNLGAAQVKFRDLPDRHWAEAAVYKLVKAGITSGYPDGTYQGLKNMNRQEIIVLLSKLAEKAKDIAAYEKLAAELKTEWAAIKYQIEYPEKPQIDFDFQTRYRGGNVFLNNSGPHGPRADYRLKASALRYFGKDHYIKLRMDTMDAGFNGFTREAATKLFDLEGKIKLGAFDLLGVIGPGTVTHTETDGIIPSEDYYIYIRPKTSVKLSTSRGLLDFTLSYVTRQVKPWGEVGLNEIYSTAAINYRNLPLLGKIKITATPRYLWNNNGLRDLRGELQLDVYPLKFINGQLLLGAGHVKSIHGLYAKGIFSLTAPRTAFSLKAQKVGSDYRAPMDKYEFVFLNNFCKLVLDGSVDVGWEFSQALTDDLNLKLISDLVLTGDYKYGENYPGTSLTHEIDLYTENINLFYRSYFVPSGLSSTDPTMVRTIAASSDLMGISFSIKI